MNVDPEALTPLHHAPRRVGRILALQLMCQAEILGDEGWSQAPEFLAESGAPPESVRYARDLASRAWSNREAWDRRMTAAAPQWPAERMSSVERNILRIAVEEMMSGVVPPRAAIDEAIEIAREFGGADSPRFINGVLDGIYRKMREETGEA